MSVYDQVDSLKEKVKEQKRAIQWLRNQMTTAVEKIDEKDYGMARLILLTARDDQRYF